MRGLLPSNTSKMMQPQLLSRRRSRNVLCELTHSFDDPKLTLCSRRIDYRLLPILGMMYSISLVDRTNLGLAMVAGMQEDLGLTVGNRYTILVMIFFVAYILFEIPSVSIPLNDSEAHANDDRTWSCHELVLQTGSPSLEFPSDQF